MNALPLLVHSIGASPVRAAATVRPGGRSNDPHGVEPVGESPSVVTPSPVGEAGHSDCDIDAIPDCAEPGSLPCDGSAGPVAHTPPRARPARILPDLSRYMELDDADDEEEGESDEGHIDGRGEWIPPLVIRSWFEGGSRRV